MEILSMVCEFSLCHLLPLCTYQVIAMTANAFSEDVTNAIKAGMDYHLAKPIDIGILMGILNKYLQAPA